MRIFSSMVMSVILIGCGTTKGYIGSNVDASQLATIGAYRYAKMGFPTRVENYLLLKSGDIEVGSFMKGYPEKIQVLAGINKITFEYKHNLDKSILGVAFSTGALPASIDESQRDKHIITLELGLKGGHEYKIMFYPNLKSGDDKVPSPWVVDIGNSEIVYGELPDGVTDPLLVE